jgi:hypothetical protein
MKICFRALCSLTLLIGLGASRVSAAPVDPPAASPVAQLNTEEIVTRMVERNLERARALGAYQGTRVYHLEYRGFPSSRSAEMVVDVKYRSPGTKDFSIRSQHGSKFIIDRIFKRRLQTEEEALTRENQNRVALNRDNYRFALAGVESMPTGPSYVLSVEPRTDDKLLYRGRIWVDAQDFAVVRIEAAPAKNPSFWTKETKIEQVYGKVGNFWLPVFNRSSSEVRLGGHASFTIDYQDYQITAATALRRPGELAGYP